MPDLSVLITARNERFLPKTIEDVLAHAERDTEIIVVLDGAWADPPIPSDPRVTVIHHESIGQRAAINEAARISTATYVMKLDAHCAVGQGFDRLLIEPYESGELTREDTTIPRLYNLHVFDRKCRKCGERFYQDALPDRCGKCNATAGFDTVMVWEPRWSRRTDFNRFDNTLHYQYWPEYKKRPEAQGDLCDMMTALGACFFMRRDRFWELGGMDEDTGSWGQFGVEVACKSWLSGGRHVVNKRTWYAHMFRTHPGPDWGFPYPLDERQVERARQHSRAMWFGNTWPGQVRPLSWLVEKFWPVPGWTEEDLTKLQEAGAQFERERRVAA